MKDLMGLSRKASDITKNTEAYQELFADLFLEEMNKDERHRHCKVPFM